MNAFGVKNSDFQKSLKEENNKDDKKKESYWDSYIFIEKENLIAICFLGINLGFI